ncbi:hypothetical protein [Brevibacterium aurantiacum]|uniref:hypothetical protein n=1 Tax=Brevibacterium aurantiacum TaxID=273384 RepID=UPI00186707F4|nr:hypothetical protein [Brevibacterium aurantiacum]
MLPGVECFTKRSTGGGCKKHKYCNQQHFVGGIMVGVRSVTYALSQLLLPIAQHNFHAAWERAQHKLEPLNLVTEEERADYLSFEIDRWREQRKPTAFLKRLVSECLSVEESLGELFPSKYFDAHKKLTGQGNLSFENASALLSHSNLIARLLNDEHLSCAQIAGVLSARRGGFEYNWHQLKLVARALGGAPELDEEEILKLSDEDVAGAPEKFGDASPKECIELIGDIGTRLGYPSDLADALYRFFPDAKSFVPAYSVILNTNLLVVDSYDHPASAAYEFQPRGLLSHVLQRDKHPSYHPSESAYLNNSKGAFAFDRNWAWSRKGSGRVQALALADLLDGLSQMAYPARRELASWIRSWLMRIEEDFVVHRVEVEPPSWTEIENFFDRISAENTRTFGILEQRAVDFLATAWFDTVETEYDVRGRGDSVSASNTAKAKLGDVEFKSKSLRQVRAFEAHGGKLSKFYVDIHGASFSKILPKRQTEFDQLGIPESWDIEVIFIAHEIEAKLKNQWTEEVCKYNVRWTCKTYSETWVEVLESVDRDLLTKLFHVYVTEPISGRWVSDGVKSKFNKIVSE